MEDEGYSFGDRQLGHTRPASRDEMNDIRMTIGGINRVTRRLRYDTSVELDPGQMEA